MFVCFSPSVVVVDFIGIMKSNYIFELFFFSTVTFFVVINLCLYVGLLQFCGVSLFFLSFFNFTILNLLLFFFTFIPLFAFPTILFPLQLIFNVYKSSLFTSIQLCIPILSFFPFLSTYLLVSFVFIALFPTWHLALVLFSSLCFN